MANFLDTLTEKAFDVAAREGVTVVAESNILPSSVTLYDARDTSPSLLDALGIRTHVVARTDDGRVLAEYGEPVSFNPLLALLYGSVVVLGFLAVLKAVRKHV